MKIDKSGIWLISRGKLGYIREFHSLMTFQKHRELEFILLWRSDVSLALASPLTVETRMQKTNQAGIIEIAHFGKSSDLVIKIHGTWVNWKHCVSVNNCRVHKSNSYLGYYFHCCLVLEVN